MLILVEGDRIPVDGVLLSSNNVSVDEALLTGESVRSGKYPGLLVCIQNALAGMTSHSSIPGHWSCRGQGLVEVKSTGARTEMGKIGTVLQTVEQDETRLKGEISRIMRTIAIVGIFLCTIIVVVYGMSRGNWIEGLLAGITLAMAILPEVFPLVLTIFLVLGT
jgi:Ca2+-transporting ATPase